MEDLKPVIAKNIIGLRKLKNWTQAELAQKLNYSDKAVSKWERAECIPDITVLKEVVDLFGVKIDYLLETEHAEGKDLGQAISKQKKNNHLIIALLSTSLVFLIATIVLVVLELYSIKFLLHPWMVYIYALPIACIVLLVFNSIWGKRKISFIIITTFLWGILVAVYLSILNPNIWLVFMVGIPAQIMILLCVNFKLKHK
jgi:transcriptional regulator with XRE-family HTH domain